MAEVLAGIAGVASVAGLADVCCRLAATTYKSFRAIKDAPKSVENLTKRLGTLQNLLDEVNRLLDRYRTSLIVTEDGFSIQTLEALLKECRAELVKIENSTAAFGGMTGKLRDVRRSFKWIDAERKIERHCNSLEKLSGEFSTRLSIAGR